MKRSELKRSNKPLKRAELKRRRTVELVCDGCGVTFERRTDMVNRRGPTNFCTSSCANRTHYAQGIVPPVPPRLGTEKQCEECGKPFYVSPSQLSQRFCSHRCDGRGNTRRGFIGSADNAGKKNGRYRDGKRIGEHINKRAVRAAVKERDGDWCLVCGMAPPGLHLHRVCYASEGGIYELENCVQLCGNHHAVAHSNKRYFKPLLLAYMTAEISATELRTSWEANR